LVETVDFALEPFKNFAQLFVCNIIQARRSLKREISVDLVREDIRNVEPLLYDYCQQWLTPTYPDFEQIIKQEMTQIDLLVVPVAMREREMKTLALLQHLANIKESDLVAENLVNSVKYNQEYFEKIMTTVFESDEIQHIIALEVQYQGVSQSNG
jgi:hypothetical protein